MIVVNTDFITGKKIVTLSLVKGSTIQSKHLGKDIMQSFKTLVGGISSCVDGSGKFDDITGIQLAYICNGKRCGHVDNFAHNSISAWRAAWQFMLTATGRLARWQG